MAEAAAASPPGRVSDLADRLSRLRGIRRYLAAGTAGAVATLSLPPMGLLPALYVGFVALVWLLGGSPARRTAFATGWWFGFGYFAVSLYWIGNALLVRAEAFAWLLPAVALGLPAVLALFAGLAVLSVRTLRSPLARGIGLALAWAVAEWLRGHLFTGFPWNLFGYAWAASESMLQSAAIFGAYGVSLLAVFSCGLAAGLAERSVRRRVWAGALAVALPVAAWTGGQLRLAGSPPPGEEVVAGVGLRVVQANIPQREKWSRTHQARNFRRHYDLSIDGRPPWVTHLIWPETAATFFLADDADARRVLAGAVPRGGLLMTGAPRRGQPPRLHNAMVVIDDAGRVVATYDKAHLVPFGEYVPFARYLPLDAITEGGSGYAPGPGPRTLHLPGVPSVSPLICYEVIFPGAVSDPEDRPQWLLNLTNDAWYGRTAGPHQHLAITRMRAVEEGVPVVRAAYTGISAVVDPWGRIISQLPLGTAGVIDARLPAALAARPPYARFGDLVFGLGLCLMACALAVLCQRDGKGRGSRSRANS